MINRRMFLGITCAAGVSGLLAVGRSGTAAPVMRFTVNHTPEQWRKILGPERYAILREASTEYAFTSPLLKEHRRGIFVCAGCVLPLFSSSTKFESGTGWPSFWQALPHAVVTRSDKSLMVERAEVFCARCGGHLGHAFDDGPKPTGLRYCMNGVALKFRTA